MLCNKDYDVLVSSISASIPTEQHLRAARFLDDETLLRAAIGRNSPWVTRATSFKLAAPVELI
jgi:hypothetical protein